MKEKLKSFVADDTLFYIVLLILIAVISFGLGRQSVTEQTVQNRSFVPKITEIQPLVVHSDKESLASSNSPAVVASKSGSKYHLLTCPGAKQIKESNIIEFPTIQAAEAAGYTPAANCQF